MSNPKVGDIGINFDYIIRRNGVVFDLTGLTTGNITLTYQKSDGTNFIVNPTLIVNPTQGQVRYKADTTMLTVAGQWLVQGFVIQDVSNKFHSDQVLFTVDPVL